MTPLTRELFEESLRQIRDERWICKHCAFTTYREPSAPHPRGIVVYACPDCGHTDWKHTTKSIP